MKTSIGSEIIIGEPTNAVMAWCEENLVFDNPEYTKKVRMGFWVGNTPKWLHMYARVDNQIHIPYGCVADLLPLTGRMIPTFKEQADIDFPGEVPLYDYQEQAVEALLKARYGILQSPAGSGKTQMGIALASRIGKRTLWLTHTKDLLQQSKERAERYFPVSGMGTITEGKVDIGNLMTFATVQTMANLDLSQYRDEWDTIICDECFPAGTMITTEEGTKTIEAVDVGDRVLTLDHQNHKLECRKVTYKYIKTPHSMVTITLADGTEINCTDNHPILTKSRYKRAGELQRGLFGDEVCCLRKDFFLEWVGVDSITFHKPTGDGKYGSLCSDGNVYNLEVEGNHNYFANGINVHNCHRVAGSPTAVTMFSKVLNWLRARHKYGLSATVHRADGMIKATFCLLGPVVYSVPTEAVADKIMTVHVKPVDTGIGLDPGFLNTDGTVNYARMLTWLGKCDERNEVILYDLVANGDHSNLVLSDRLDHLRRLYESLPDDLREKAAVIDGKMTSKKAKAERAEAIEKMRTGDLSYLFATYSLAKEGLDIPRLDRLYLTTPQKDYAIITQSIGRVARTFKGKEDPVVFDYIDNMNFLEKSYKKRRTSYKKAGCVIEERT